MARQKIYPEEFLVRATVEERRLIDGLAHKEKKSRSRFLVMTALTAQRNQGINANTFEALVEVRRMALMDLRRLRHILEHISNQEKGTSSDKKFKLEMIIEELVETLELLKRTWGYELSPSQK